MRRALFVFLLVSGTATAAEQASLGMGKLVEAPTGVSQTVSVSNATRDRLGFVKVECLFFRGQTPLGSGAGSVQDLAPGQTRSIEVVSLTSRGADRAECRTVGN